MTKKQKINFECINCDDVFDIEKEAKEHAEWHKNIFKKNRKKILTGYWKRLIR